MNNKFKLTDETIITSGKVLYRIQALKSFGEIKEGDLGGFIEKEENLSARGNCWIYDNACVYDHAYIANNAKVHDNAYVLDNARVYGNACITNNAVISSYAKVYDYAYIYGNVKIRGNAHVYGNANIYGDAHVYGNADIYGNVQIYDNANISGNAKIHDNASIYGNAVIYDNANICDNAVIYGDALIRGKTILKNHHCIKEGCCISDLSKNLIESIRLQVGLLPINGEVIAYKQVNKDLSSFYDSSFIYKVGEWAEVTDYDTSSASCASGLHFSNPNYWNIHERIESSTILIAKIKLEDIITVQKGKIRCKRAFILGTYNVE